jgi:hypothetical protein
MPTRQELCELFEIKTRAVKETMRAAFIDSNKLNIDDRELERFTRARELLTGPASVTYEQVKAIIGEEFGIKPGDTSEAHPETELGDTCVTLGHQLANKIADNAVAIAAALLPAAIERRLLDASSPLNVRVDQLARNIHDSTIDVEVVAQEALVYSRQELIILDAPEVKMLAS